MAEKEILLYGAIYDWSVEDFINQMEAAKNQDVVVRVNSPGGDVMSGWGLIAKFQEHTKGKKIKVDGQASSMAFIALLFADSASALSTSRFVAHRAGYASWIEKDKNLMTQDMWDRLNATNAHFRTAMEAKLDIAKFEKIAGITLDEFFSNDTRIDVTLTAQQAKEIGLVNEIVPLTANLKAEIESYNSYSMGMAAFRDGLSSEKPALPKASATPPTTQNNNDMNLAELKKQHPALVAEVLQEERDRVAAWMEWNDVDAKAVAEGIKGGKDMTKADISAFSKKMASANGLQALRTEAADPAPTPETPVVAPTAENKELTAFADEVNKMLGLEPAKK